MSMTAENPDASIDGVSPDRDVEVLRLLRFAATTEDSARAREARERAAELLIGFAYAIASRYSRRGVEVDDLRQVAAVAVVLAVGRFDHAQESAFFGYVSVTVHGELKRYLRDHGWAVRPGRADHDRYHQVVGARRDLAQSLGAEPTTADIADYLGMPPSLVRATVGLAVLYTAASLESMVTDQPGVLQEHTRGVPARDLIEEMITTATLDQYLQAFSARDRSVLRMRFELDLTQREIGEHLGISQMNVSRVLSSALARLRETLTGTVYDPAC